MGRERDIICVREKHQRNINQLPPNQGIKTLNLGMCPDQGLNLEVFGVWDVTPSS